MTISVEDYVLKYRKYHPELVKFTSNFLPFWVLQKAIPIILSKESVPSGRRSKQGSQSKSRTPAFMLLNRMYWGKGVLNKKGDHAGNNFDLSTPKGMALFLHEAFHVYQWFRNPFKLIFQYIYSPIISLLRGRILFDHQYIPFEIEAIKFQLSMEKLLGTEEYKEKLEVFRSL